MEAQGQSAKLQRDDDESNHCSKRTKTRSTSSKTHKKRKHSKAKDAQSCIHCQSSNSTASHNTRRLERKNNCSQDGSVEPDDGEISFVLRRNDQSDYGSNLQQNGSPLSNLFGAGGSPNYQGPLSPNNGNFSFVTMAIVMVVCCMSSQIQVEGQISTKSNNPFAPQAVLSSGHQKAVDLQVGRNLMDVAEHSGAAQPASQVGKEMTTAKISLLTFILVWSYDVLTAYPVASSLVGFAFSLFLLCKLVHSLHHCSSPKGRPCSYQYGQPGRSNCWSCLIIRPFDYLKQHAARKPACRRLFGCWLKDVKLGASVLIHAHDKQT